MLITFSCEPILAEGQHVWSAECPIGPNIGHVRLWHSELRPRIGRGFLLVYKEASSRLLANLQPELASYTDLQILNKDYIYLNLYNFSCLSISKGYALCLIYFEPTQKYYNIMANYCYYKYYSTDYTISTQVVVLVVLLLGVGVYRY